MQLVPQLGELGLFGTNLHGYGCAGMNNVAYGLVMQELERGDSGLRSFASVQGSLVMYPIHSYGSDAQKERWLPELAAGNAVGCFGLTEPDAGSNVAGMLTRAAAEGRPLGPERNQALDHQRLPRRRLARLGEDGGRRAGLPRRDATDRASRCGTSRASSRCGLP